jgi:hypothetical protein
MPSMPQEYNSTKLISGLGITKNWWVESNLKCNKKKYKLKFKNIIFHISSHMSSHLANKSRTDLVYLIII